MKRVVLDTNLYIDWINGGLREERVVGPGYTRILSVVVLMELWAGTTTARSRKAVECLERAYTAAQRLLAPPTGGFAAVGRALRDLSGAGWEVRSGSLVNDTLIAISARSVGATLVTRDRSDFEAIRGVIDFDLEVLT